MAQAEKNQAVFAVMRIYGTKDGNLYLEDRAVIEAGEEYPPGERVMFSTNGRKYFGDVIRCFRTEPEDQLYQLLKDLAERNVMVHFRSVPLDNENGQ